MCDRTGLADMSDDKSTKIGDYDTRIEAVTQGFEIKGKDVICSDKSLGEQFSRSIVLKSGDQ
jgi:hypothetical protein